MMLRVSRCVALQAFRDVMIVIAGDPRMRAVTGRAAQSTIRLLVTRRLQHSNWLEPSNLRILPTNPLFEVVHQHFGHPVAFPTNGDFRAGSQFPQLESQMSGRLDLPFRRRDVLASRSMTILAAHVLPQIEDAQLIHMTARGVAGNTFLQPVAVFHLTKLRDLLIGLQPALSRRDPQSLLPIVRKHRRSMLDSNRFKAAIRLAIRNQPEKRHGMGPGSQRKLQGKWLIDLARDRNSQSIVRMKFIAVRVLPLRVEKCLSIETARNLRTAGVHEGSRMAARGERLVLLQVTPAAHLRPHDARGSAFVEIVRCPFRVVTSRSFW